MRTNPVSMAALPGTRHSWRGYRKKCRLWGVAQLAERLAVNQEVGGSNPPTPVAESVGIKRLFGLWVRGAVVVCARWRARKDPICLLRLSEFATFEYHLEHGRLVGLLVYEA